MTSLAEARQVAIEGRINPTVLSVERGTLTAVVGPNGGGKTSLLRGLARTEDAVGSVSVEGKNIDQTGEIERRRLIAFMPASREAPWPVTVADYVEFGLGKADAERVAALMAMLELEPLAMRPVDRLSTGERARAMLGRTIAGKARLLLLDEPLSNLDPYWVLRTLDILRAEIEENGSSALVSLHDLTLLSRFDRVLLISGGELLADAAPRDVLDSEAFGTAFRIDRDGPGWAIRRPADPRSLR
jgi:iron complex transport system ATP-binding protein